MAEPVTVVLAVIVKKVFETIAGKVTEKIWTKLQGDPAHKAFQEALGAAIARYSSNATRASLARPLLEEHGPLAEEGVAAELGLLIRFERDADTKFLQPNPLHIGERWKDYLDIRPPMVDYTAEAALLIKYLSEELHATEVFRPVFEAQTLEVIAHTATLSTEKLAEIESTLTDMVALMDSRFSDFLRATSGATFDIRGQIRDFSQRITDKTTGFVGRQFVFEAFEQFKRDNPRGYFQVQGDPGIGKSALAAKLVKDNAYIHHFNIRSEGINRTDMFLRNICAQIIAVYGLDHSSIPVEASQDNGFLVKLLNEVSQKLSGKKTVIVVDSLDEVDSTGLPAGANTLFLPRTLPPGIFFFVTMRRDAPDVKLSIDCEQESREIKHDSADNQADIALYILEATARPGIQHYVMTHQIDASYFIAQMVEKSEGNFIYLYYVLPELERGTHQNRSLDNLPHGLENYYEDHWQIMKGQAGDEWFTYKLPVIMALVAAREPVPVEQVADFSGVQETIRVRAVILEWKQFLHVDTVDYQGYSQRRYSIYHSSFLDFIAKKEEVEEEMVNRMEALKKITTNFLNKLYKSPGTQ
jgi:hypothetical protein